VRRTLAFAQACDLVIGPDTGIMWGVAFEAVPKIMLLSHASPENITKHWINTITLTANQGRVPCWPCHQLHDDHSTCTPNADNSGAACMTDISVEAIIGAARTVWGDS
jgi:ADP-heptose:LPS heptosyltransferase